ncbi:MAG: CARDB domain-containing protein [Solirubrobacterales bacterium]
MKRLIAIAASVAVTAMAGMSLAGPANAADESATASLTMESQNGKLSKTEYNAVNWSVNASISAPASSPKVQPMKKITFNFPKDMKFVPSSKVPVCGDSDVGPAPVNLSVPPDEVIARCPNAVLGNGTAVIRLGQANCDDCFQYLADPVLVIFNGGTNGSGQPKLKIYGYSAQTTVGIYMEGALVNGTLEVAIPQLTADSATAEFNLNIPGNDSPFANRRGVDKTYVQAKCSTGTWLTNATFELGSRDAANNPTTPTETVVAPQTSQNCTGISGQGKLGNLKLNAPKKVKAGKKFKAKIKIKNRGNANLTNVRLCLKTQKKFIKGTGKRCRVLSNLAAGKTKAVKFNLKTKKRKGKKTKLKAIASKSGTVKRKNKVVVLK